MTKVLVCWEDRFHGKLDVCVRRALRHLGLASPELYFDDCRGNGGFVPYIERDWPRLAQRGLPKSRGPRGVLTPGRQAKVLFRLTSAISPLPCASGVRVRDS